MIKKVEPRNLPVRRKRPSMLKAGLVALLLVLISGAAMAQHMLPTRSWVFGEWLPIAALVVIIAYLVVALAYMIGIGFQYRDVVAWAHSELWEATLNAMIVGVCVGIILIISDVTILLTGSVDHFDEAWKYLERVGGDLYDDWKGLLYLSEGLSFAASVWIKFSIPIPLVLGSTMTAIPLGSIIVPETPVTPGFYQQIWARFITPSPVQVPSTVAYYRTLSTLAFLAGWQQILSGLGPLIYAVAVGLLATYAQRAMLTFAQNNMLTVFLPLGIMARSFPLTRKMGGTIIAMALALYFVYPLTLVLSDQVYRYTGINEDPSSSYVDNIAGGEGGESINTLVKWMAPTVKHVVIVMLMFVLSVIITITSFRAIAVSVGGDPNVFGLGKMGM